MNKTDLKSLYYGVILYFGIRVISDFIIMLLLYLPFPFFAEYPIIILIGELVIYALIIWLVFFKFKPTFSIKWWMIMIIALLYIIPKSIMYPHYSMEDFKAINTISDYELIIKTIFNLSILLLAYFKYKKIKQ